VCCTLKEYQKALIIVKSTSKADAKANSLLKISVITEDKEFKVRLDQLIKAYSYYISPRYSRSVPPGSDIPTNNSTWLAYLKPYKEELIRYAEEMLTNKVPQWQILAKRNGWSKTTK